MRGIQAAFTGRLGQDADLKTSKSGNPWASFSVAVDAEASEEATTWVRVAVFGQLATRLHSDLKKGAEVYVEGKLRLESWTGKDGRERTGLSVAASRVEVLGGIGFDPTSRSPEEPRGAHHEIEGQGCTEQDLPF
jgi:single-strand DNA-binding protein